MITIAVRRAFMAQHYLIGGDWGAENQPHAHHYVAELQLAGNTLNQHQFLLDIVDVERCLDNLLATYKNRLLNEHPAFWVQGQPLNPSVELFAQRLCEGVAQSLDTTNLQHIAMQLWESETAWARYEMTLQDQIP